MEGSVRRTGQSLGMQKNCFSVAQYVSETGYLPRETLDRALGVSPRSSDAQCKSVQAPDSCPFELDLVCPLLVHLTPLPLPLVGNPLPLIPLPPLEAVPALEPLLAGRPSLPAFVLPLPMILLLAPLDLPLIPLLFPSSEAIVLLLAGVALKLANVVSLSNVLSTSLLLLAIPL